MARNFYKQGGSYYYADNNQPIVSLPELQAAAEAGGMEVATQTRNFYKKDGNYYYSDNDQQITDLNALQSAAQAGGRELTEQEAIDEKYANAVAKNPVINELTKGGSTVDEIIYALETGDLTGIVDANGQPFSVEAQQEALARAQEDNKLYYEALKAKEQADVEAQMTKDQADYQNYLLTSGQEFEADKATLDQQSADRGVLFSGSRAQKERDLKRAYEQNQDYAAGKVASSIGTAARDYQYKYGNEAAGGLSQYYNLGRNTYNPNVARDGVGTSSLSSIYSPSKYTFQGTRNVERSTAANVRAADDLKNRGNKLLSTGYNNQF